MKAMVSMYNSMQNTNKMSRHMQFLTMAAAIIPTALVPPTWPQGKQKPAMTIGYRFHQGRAW